MPDATAGRGGTVVWVLLGAVALVLVLVVGVVVAAASMVLVRSRPAAVPAPTIAVVPGPGPAAAPRGPSLASSSVMSDRLLRGAAADSENVSSFAVGPRFGLVRSIEYTDGFRAGNGTICVFDVSTRREIDRIEGPAGATDFGNALAVSGDTAVIGHLNFLDRGRAFVLDVPSRRLTALKSPDSRPGDAFGRDVATDGTFAVVAEDGAAHVFDAATGTHLRKLIPAEPAESFGRFAAADAGRAVVGTGGAGGAYLFDLASGRQLAKLTSPEADDAVFAEADVNGRFVVVRSLKGRIHVFDRETGRRARTLRPADEPSAVRLAGSLVLVGCGAAGEEAAGRVYVYDATTGDRKGTLSGLAAAAGARFGAGLDCAVTGANEVLVWVAAPGDVGSRDDSVFTRTFTPGTPP